MREFFPEISAIRYKGAQSTNPLAFKFYDPERVVLGRPMKEHLPFAMAWWHNLGANGTDLFGRGTADKSFGCQPGTMEHARAKADAGFEFMEKLGIRYFCATLACHAFEHELRFAAIHGMLGSIDANQGDPHLGWDTDEFPFDVYSATFAMLEVLRAGGLTGGFNFDAKNRRPSYTHEDMFKGFILGMDTFALGLLNAAKIIEDGRLDTFVKERYASYESGIGRRIVEGKATLTELADYAASLGAPELPGSGNQEGLQGIVNQILFGGA